MGGGNSSEIYHILKTKRLEDSANIQNSQHFLTTSGDDKGLALCGCLLL